jgi:hypothetical protein
MYHKKSGFALSDIYENLLKFLRKIREKFLLFAANVTKTISLYN